MKNNFTFYDENLVSAIIAIDSALIVTIIPLIPIVDLHFVGLLTIVLSFLLISLYIRRKSIFDRAVKARIEIKENALTQ